MCKTAARPAFSSRQMSGYAQRANTSKPPSRSPTSRQPTPPSLSLSRSQSWSSTSPNNTRETSPNSRESPPKANPPEPPARSSAAYASHAPSEPPARSVILPSRSLSFGRSLSSRTSSSSEERGEPRSLSLSASAGSTLRQARQIAGMLATEGAREAQDEVDQRVVRLSSGSPAPRSPRTSADLSTTQVVSAL